MLDGRRHCRKCRSGISSRHHLSGDDHQRREQFRAIRLIRVPKPPDRDFAAKRSIAAAPEQRNPPRSYGDSSGGGPRSSSYYPTVTAGLVLGPRGVGTMAAMPVVGKLIGRVDRRPGAHGLVILRDDRLDAGHFADDDRHRRGDPGRWSRLPFRAAQHRHPVDAVTRAAGEGVGIFSLSRNICSSVGISVVNSLCTTNTQVSHAENRAARHFRESDIRAPWHRSEDNRNTSAMPSCSDGHRASAAPRAIPQRLTAID
jgi:hypothetical protein